MEIEQSRLLWATRTFDDERWDEPHPLAILRAGVIGGAVGAVTTWVYQALVWVGVQHSMPLSRIPPNAVGMAFGPHVQIALGGWALLAGTTLHFLAALIWGMLFAAAWPYLHKRDYEATLMGLGIAVLAWSATCIAAMTLAHTTSGSLVPVLNMGYLIAEIFFAVPMALIVKRLLSEESMP